MRVLVTGSSGFIGKAIVSQLALAGHDVIGLHRRVAPCGDHGIAVVAADIASRADIARLAGEMPPCEAIVHCAASLDMSPWAGEVTLTNCLGTQNMLWLFSRWGTRRFIFLSSLPVIGQPRVLPITEDHPVHPRSAYHASKVFGEELVRLARGAGTQTCSLRVTAPVGPGLPENRLLRFFVKCALANESLPISGKGTRRQNYVDVRDIARATLLSLQGEHSGVFNVAGSDCISNLDLARLCIAHCHSTSRIHYSGREDPEDVFNWEVSIEKAGRLLGYAPRYGVVDAIEVARRDLVADS